MSGGTGSGHRVILPPASPEESSFKDNVLSDLSGVFFNTYEFAETVIYTPYGGSQQFIKAIIDYGIDSDYGGTLTIFERALVRVATTGTYGITVSRKGDTVTVDDVVWTVELPRKSTDGMSWEIEVVR